MDILATATGKPDHPGRVRGEPRSVTLSQYFGRASSLSSQGGISPQLLSELTTTIEARVEARMEEQVAARVDARVEATMEARMQVMFEAYMRKQGKSPMEEVF